MGAHEHQWDLRTARLMFRGRLKLSHPVDYIVSFEVKGQDHVDDDGGKLGFTDVDISTGLGRLGTLHFGKVKEPFVYEMVGDAANLQQQERALNPFFASRGIGLRLTNAFAADAMTYSLGWFNRNIFAARVTGLPYWAREGASYVHVGLGVRYLGDEDGTLRFKGRPESNVTPYYVDSGSLAGDHANELSLEGIWGRGPLLITVDHAQTWVAAAASGNPRFAGSSIAASYTLTGEHRPYDRKVAYARRILPRRKWGAWEVVGRYSHVDLADQMVDGGRFRRQTLGLNWWATRRWKLGFDYGLIRLARSGLTGTTNAFHTRLQWVY